MFKFICTAWIGAATTCFASALGTTYNSDITIGDLRNLYISLGDIKDIRQEDSEQVGIKRQWLTFYLVWRPFLQEITVPSCVLSPPSPKQ